MATDTDVRLRSSLDTNQRDRQQMCRSVLAVDPHYSDVTPRHPSGGRDGGRDLEAVFDGQRIAYGAVGFHHGANDSEEQKKQIRSKFSSDLKSALAAKSDLKVFAFLTNLHFTMGEQSEMREEALKAGIEHCDILDRERLRIELDSPAGFFVRFQYLNIPLSEAEQASFLAHYGDRIQEVVSTGFQRIERSLNRILFLHEAGDVLQGIFVRFQLKESYPATEVGHFRAFVSLFLHAVKHDILMMLFGSSDKANRFRDDVRDDRKDQIAGIAHGIGSGQWENQIKLPRPGSDHEKSNPDMEPSATEQKARSESVFVCVGSGSSIGMDRVPAITIHYSHDDWLIRFRPRLDLRDLDDAMFLPLINRSLAEKLRSIEVFANGYKLAHIGLDDFRIDYSPDRISFPDSSFSHAFTPEELADPWVRIRPSNVSSNFQLEFMSATPRRMFGHKEIPDRLK